jgi:hypothetical protein
MAKNGNRKKNAKNIRMENVALSLLRGHLEILNKSELVNKGKSVIPNINNKYVDSI